ncbi:tetratricopeptide repeat protein [Labilibacter sediminis]|nr:tetratricopeptide repeat protein [Labilibacter sediminis]
MKTSPLLPRLLLTAIFISSMISLFAQDVYLPSSTKSKEIKEMYQQSIDAMLQADIQKGQQLADKALKADPNFFMGYFIKTFTNNKDERVKYLKLMADYNAKLNKGEKILKNMAAANIKDPKASSVPYARDIAKAYKKNLFANNMLAFYLMNENKPEEALTYLNTNIKLKPDWPPTQNLMGYAYLRLENYEKAKIAFNKYIALAPDIANPYDSKGDYYMATKEYNKALKSFEKAYSMNNQFEISRKKADKAKWLISSDKIKPIIDKHTTDILNAFIARDLKKYHSYFNHHASFKFIWNGEENNSLKEMMKMDYKNQKEWDDFSFELKKQMTNVINDECAVSTQKFDISVSKKDGTSIKAEGFWSLVWMLMDDKWKVIQAIETTNFIE